MRRKFFLLLILVALGIISCKTDDSDSANVLQKFSVTFDSDGGSKVKGQVIESGKTATKPENPTKDGYDFEVWVLGDSPFDFSTPIISDITLKAKWTKHTSTTLPEEQKQFFTVTFDTNGGSGIVSQKIENGKTVTKPENPTKDGYDFEVWVLGDSPFDFSTPIISDITLKAKWTKHTSTTLPEEQKQFFTVTFDTNGGSGIVSQKIENGKTVTKPEDPYRERYSFIGWFIGDNKFDFSTPITSDITLTAKWVKLFTVKFDYDDVDHNVETKEVEEGQLITDVPNKSKQSGYSLAGWLINGTEFDFENTVITANITLKAKYYCDSITSTLTMKNGWGDRNFQNLPIVEIVIISCKGKTLDSSLVTRQELTYPRKDKNTHDHDVDLSRGAFGTASLDGHTYAFDLYRKTHYTGLVSTGDDLRVSRCAYSPYETKYSIVEVKRDNQKKNRYGSWVDVISIYIDIDF